VTDRINELIRAKITVTPIVPVNSPVDPEAVAMGKKAITLVKVEASKGIKI
jgi:hypothetical protein